MTSKSKTMFGIVIILAVVAGFCSWAWYKYLRGTGPALFGPAADIVEIIDKYNEQVGGQSEGTNQTDFPLTLPDNFSISIFARDLPGARDIEFDSQGNMWVSQTREGLVSLLKIEDGQVASQNVILRDLDNPHGLALGDCTTTCFELNPDGTGGGCHDLCKLYVAEEGRVIRFSYDPSDIGDITSTRENIVDLPTGGKHTTRTLLLGSDENLYVSIGSSCNVCYEEDDRRASIIVVDTRRENLGAWQSYAVGLRNSVFMTTHPQTGDIWATEMGRDFLGDDLPPDEINIIKSRQLNSRDLPADYGWPLCYGENVHDTDFDDLTYIANPCSIGMRTIPSHIDLPAHVAPLGLAFIPRDQSLEEDMWYNLLVAYHGSWNRSEPVGYKIVRIKLDEDGNYLGEEDFISGWLTTDNRALGRPVDILVQPGGIVYLSDDKAGVIYKIIHD